MNQKAQTSQPPQNRSEHKAPARPARLKTRHVILLASFLLWVAIPLGVVGGYLFAVASDQYASYVGFTVRKEDVGSPVEFLGGIADLSSSGSSDTDILFKYIKGRQMIRAVDETLDLAAIYENPRDPVFTLAHNASIEQAQRYWQRVVDVFYDTSSGLIEIRVVAFDPNDARDVARAILDESTRMINALSTIAREDTTRYARDELDRAIARLKAARQQINAFRTRTQIVDPFADTQGHMSLVNTLQTQLAATLIELDLLRQTARDSDPRIAQSERRVRVIQDRISAERERFGSDQGAGDDTYSKLVGEYEALAVDLEFGEKSYLSALATYDAALAEARRQSRYLAPYTSPTLAETPEYPQRWILLALVGAALFVSWAIAILVYYSLRDRR